MRIVAYTAAFGEQPAPHTQPLDLGIPLVCYTDRPDLVAPRYDVRVMRSTFADPRMMARYVKIMAHEVLGPVDWAIWFDAEVIFKTGRMGALVDSLGSGSLAAHAHSMRDCVYDEAAVCKHARLDDPRRIDALMTRYRERGYPARAGLFESGLLVRRLTDPNVVRLNETWWRDVLEGSTRDQLSLPVVARQLGIAVHVLPGWVFNSPICALAEGPMLPAPRPVPSTVPLGRPDRWDELYDPAPASILRRARRRLGTRLLVRSGLFDPAFYREQAGATAGPFPLGHYLTTGWRHALDPHPLFDVSFYLENAPEVSNGGLEPLGHYLRIGRREGRSPHPLFDAAWYEREYGRGYSHVEGGALSHYVTRGWTIGFQPNAWFDPVEYLERYPDVAEARVEPFGHFLRHGRKEGRICSADRWASRTSHEEVTGQRPPMTDRLAPAVAECSLLEGRS